MTTPQFTTEQRATLLHHTRQQVEAATRGQTNELILPAELATIPLTGLFVTLRRGDELRACIGNWRGDTPGPLGEALATAARSAPVSDHRFRPIEEHELPDLGIELSLLLNPQPIRAKGDARVAAVEVGRHGLLLDDRRHRGLLLPQVATERGWDAETFLNHTAIKAGLSPKAWRKSSTNITTFEAVKLVSDPP